MNAEVGTPTETVTLPCFCGTTQCCGRHGYHFRRHPQCRTCAICGDWVVYLGGWNHGSPDNDTHVVKPRLLSGWYAPSELASVAPAAVGGETQ